MSATNKTTHYELPMFLGSDKPAWLVDWNGAMADIDSAIYEAKVAADGAASSASAVASDLATLSGTVSGQGTDITTISGSLTTLIGTVNTITSLIGNGTPTTDDKTIIGAINEINAKIPAGGTAASDVSYDNTDSGLTGDDVQEAIDELVTMIGADTSFSEFKRQFANKKGVIVGDSLSVESTTWANPFENLCTAIGTTIDNVSVGGYTSANMLAIVRTLTDAYDFAIVWVGTNDSYNSVSIGDTAEANSYSKNMEDIITNLLALNSSMKIFVLGPPFAADMSYSKSKCTLAYAAAACAVANLNGAAFKNMGHIVNCAPNNHSVVMNPDGIHFTESFSKSEIFSIIVNKLTVPTSDTFREVIALTKSILTEGTNVTVNSASGYFEVGSHVQYNILMTNSAQIAGGSALITLPVTMKALVNQQIACINNSTGAIVWATMIDNVIQTYGSTALPAATYTLVLDYLVKGANAKGLS